MIEFLETNLIKKRYRNGIEALKGVTLRFNRGEGPIGILGPNGAGKTTLLRIICTVLPPSSGSIHVNGVELREYGIHRYRRQIGYLPQSFGVYGTLTPEEFLKRVQFLYSGRYDMGRIRDVMEWFGIDGYHNIPMKQCSGGMIQRVGLGMCVINDPDFIVLDEPFTGLDPIERLKAMEVITRISQKKIVVFSTHIIGEIESLCSRVVIINKGRIVVEGKIEELLKGMDGMVYQGKVTIEEMERIYKEKDVIKIQNDGGDMRVRLLSRQPIKGFKKVHPVLEDLYIVSIKYGE